MLTKLKNLFFKPFPRPLAIIAWVIVAIFVAEPLLAFLVLFIDWLEPMFSFLYYFPPRLLLYMMPIILSASYLVLLLQNYFSEERSSVRLLKSALVVTLIEITIYFWYKAMWVGFMYHYYFGIFENYPNENRLDIITGYVAASIETAVAICLFLILRLYLDKYQKN